MANYIENLGLGFFHDSDDSYANLVRYVAQEGKCIFGYYGLPYINLHFGDCQMIARVVHNQEKDINELTGMDTHAAGPCIWKAKLSEMDINRKDADILERRVIVHREDGSGGLAVVNLVNADVLPSFMKDELIEMQMIGFPVLMQYFKDEDEYAEAQERTKDGKLFLLEDGMVLPSGMLRNRDPYGEDFEQDENMDDMTLIRGTVKRLYHGIFELNGERLNSYIRCMIGTQFGELELVHTIEQVDEAQRSNIRVGAVVNCVCVLSGDVAIHQYENGIVLDEPNNFALLRSTFSGNDPKRLGAVLCDDAVFESETNGKRYCGKQEIIERISEIQRNINDDPENRCFAHLARIHSIDDGEPLSYAVGTRCLVLAYGKPDNYEGILFAEFSTEGKIQKLSISKNRRYQFLLDVWPLEKPEEKEPLPVPPLSDLMLRRAKYNCLVEQNLTEEEFTADDGSESVYRERLCCLLEELQEHGETITDARNLFGYLFACTVRERLFSIETPALPAEDCEAFLRFCRDSNLTEESDEEWAELVKVGKLFYRDYAYLCDFQKLEEPEKHALLTLALILLQRIGVSYAEKLKAENKETEGV